MSNPAKALRIAIVAEWLLIVVGLVVHFRLEHTLPAELRDYLSRQAEAPSTTLDTISFVVGIPALLAAFISSIGLCFLRQWARLPYVLATAALTLVVLCDAPSVETALDAFCEELSLLAAGFAVALILYAPIKYEARNAIQALQR